MLNIGNGIRGSEKKLVIHKEKLVNAKWKKVLTCTCTGKLDECTHCNYNKREKSIPTNDFKIEWKDENGIHKESTITQIELVFGKHGDVIGWRF